MIRKIGASNQSSFYGQQAVPLNFSKIRVGVKNLEDATLELGDYKKINPKCANKADVLRAINNKDIYTMREISNFFFDTSGIYSRLCRYLAYLYRYDWMVTPQTDSAIGKEKKNGVKKEKIIDGFYKTLNFLDKFEIKKFFGEVALKVIRSGCYYGYLLDQDGTKRVQELPPNYCRSRFFVNNKPAIEFNMKYFDEKFRDTTQRERVLNLFPKEFKKGYLLYKQGKLPPDFSGDTSGWYLLDIEYTIKFNLNGEDIPFLISTIPAIIDLDAAQELDRKKMQQQLLKIIIQKMPLDKNGDLIFDVDEARELHLNAVQMLGKAIGMQVLTTFADVDVADMADNNTTTSTDDLEKVERAVYNAAGVSQMQFNTDGNIALEKSILNDEASMYNLITQFESFLNFIIKDFNRNKKIQYNVYLLPTTIYNYKDLAKLYKEQTQSGYSKMLPQIAMGHSQSFILSSVYFENEILELVNVFIPPLMSSTMNSDILNKNSSSQAQEEKKEGAGRKALDDDKKSEKTIMNQESLS